MNLLVEFGQSACVGFVDRTTVLQHFLQIFYLLLQLLTFSLLAVGLVFNHLLAVLQRSKFLSQILLLFLFLLEAFTELLASFKFYLG